MEQKDDYAMEEVAKTFSDALKAAYLISIRTNALSQLADPELTRQFCNLVTSYLKARPAPAHGDQAPAEIAEQELLDSFDESMKSVDDYMDFLGAMVAHFIESDRKRRLLSVQ